MIPFHAFHLPMPQYQPPVEPLIWIVNPSSLDIDEKILADLKILRELRMTVLMLHSISNKASMLPWREGFFRSRALVQFLNVLDADEQANKQLHVIL
jgi:hypothetical protein